MKIKSVINKISGKPGYIVLVILFGILLMSFPSNSGAGDFTHDINIYSLEREEQRLEEVLSMIEGVGKCKVLLSVQNESDSGYEEGAGEGFVILNGGKQNTSANQMIYPEFKGAVIVCCGTGSAAVRHNVLATIKAYTGLDTDKITICPMENS